MLISVFFSLGKKLALKWGKRKGDPLIKPFSLMSPVIKNTTTYL